MRTPGKVLLLGALLGGSGVLHLVRPRTFEWLVPPELGDAAGGGLGRGGPAAGLRAGAPAHVPGRSAGARTARAVMPPRG